MRVLIMSDMEGVSGSVKWAQVNGGAPMYEEGRRLYMAEVNATVRGAEAAGAVRGGGGEGGVVAVFGEEHSASSGAADDSGGGDGGVEEAGLAEAVCAVEADDDYD